MEYQKQQQRNKQLLAERIRPLVAEGLVLKLSEEEMVDMVRELVQHIKEGTS